MSYAHKLDTYLDPPHKRIVFCVYCGQDTDLSGQCPGEAKMTVNDDENFMRIFGGPPLKASNLRASKHLEKILKCT